MASNADMTGYNPEEVTDLGPEVKKSSENVATIIKEKVENGIIQPISTEWYAQEAVDFFTAFAETVKQTGTAIAEAFDSFIASIESAGNNWAENVKGDQVTLERVGEINIDISIEEIKAKDEQGNIGIREEEARGVADKLGEVRTDIETSLSEEAQKLNAETAFLGHDQAQAVTNCFDAVNKAVSKIFDFLIEGDNNLQSQITAAVDKYGEIGTETANAFNNAGSGE